MNVALSTTAKVLVKHWWYIPCYAQLCEHFAPGGRMVLLHSFNNRSYILSSLSVQQQDCVVVMCGMDGRHIRVRVRIRVRFGSVFRKMLCEKEVQA